MAIEICRLGYKYQLQVLDFLVGVIGPWMIMGGVDKRSQGQIYLGNTLFKKANWTTNWTLSEPLFHMLINKHFCFPRVGRIWRSPPHTFSPAPWDLCSSENSGVQGLISMSFLLALAHVE